MLTASPLILPSGCRSADYFVNPGDGSPVAIDTLITSTGTIGYDLSTYFQAVNPKNY